MDALLSATIRSVTPISTGSDNSGLPDIERILAGERSELNRSLGAYRKVIERARLQNDSDKEARLTERITNEANSFNARWADILAYYQ